MKDQQLGRWKFRNQKTERRKIKSQEEERVEIWRIVKKFRSQEDQKLGRLEARKIRSQKDKNEALNNEH